MLTVVIIFRYAVRFVFLAVSSSEQATILDLRCCARALHYKLLLSAQFIEVVILDRGSPHACTDKCSNPVVAIRCFLTIIDVEATD
jgi:hypothetical protein